MKLGGFAATLKFVMKMTQWGLARTEHDARWGKVSRAVAVVRTLGIAGLLACIAATAEAHPVPMRHVTVVRQTNGGQTSHAKSHGASKAYKSNDAAKNTSSKGAAVKSNQARIGSAQRKANVPAGKPGVRARTRHRKHPAQVDDHDPPTLHRASTSRHRGRNARLVRSQIARTSSDETMPSALSAPSNGGERIASAPGTNDAKPLTVNDFLHAASTPAAPATAVYARGESHPDEDVSSSPLRAAAASLKPLQSKQPIVLAHVEAAPAESEHAPVDRTAPSDLVGTPELAPERTTRTADAGDDSVNAGLRAPSRQEMIAEVEQPRVLPGLYRNGRLVVPPPLRGTREILVHQNMMADDEGLQRVQDDSDLRRMRSTRQLVDFPESASLHVNPELAGNRRCARPWAVRFASDVARDYYAHFHQPLQVNSAVRTVSYQVRLRRVNGNAAGVDGDVASPHLTGEALDFGKRGMSLQEIAWMRSYLLPLMQGGKLDVEEEFQQACFHISVYRAYLPASKRRAVVRSEVAQLREPRVPKIAPRADQDQ